MKQCTKCKRWKPRTEFYKRKFTSDKLSCWCSTCKNSQNKEWYQNNKKRAHTLKRIQRQDPDFRQKENAKTAERMRKKRSNPSYRERSNKRTRELRRKKRQERGSFWLREKIRDQQKRDWKGNGSFTEEEWNALCDRYGNICLSCGEEIVLTVDHVIPLSLSGTNTIENIQPLCLSCNCRKGTNVFDYRVECC